MKSGVTGVCGSEEPSEDCDSAAPLSITQLCSDFQLVVYRSGHNKDPNISLRSW